MDQDQSAPHLASIKMYVVVLCIVFALVRKSIDPSKPVALLGRKQFLSSGPTWTNMDQHRPLDNNCLPARILEIDFPSKVIKLLRQNNNNGADQTAQADMRRCCPNMANGVFLLVWLIYPHIKVILLINPFKPNELFYLYR